MTLSAMSLYHHHQTGKTGLNSSSHHQLLLQQQQNNSGDSPASSPPLPPSPLHQTSVFANSKGSGVKLGFSIDSIVGNTTAKRERSISPLAAKPAITLHHPHSIVTQLSPMQIKRSWSPLEHPSAPSPPAVAPTDLRTLRQHLTTAAAGSVGSPSSPPASFLRSSPSQSARDRSRSPPSQRRRSRSPVSPPRASPPSPVMPVPSIYRPTPSTPAGVVSPLPPYLDQLASLKALYEAKGLPLGAALPAHLLAAAAPNGGLLPPVLGFPPRPPPHFLGLPGGPPPPHNLPPREYPLHPWFINRHRFPLGKFFKKRFF